MGQLIEQRIPALFNGVSRMPHNVRRPDQLEEADNAYLSVITGGFEKRPATQHVAVLGTDAAAEQAVHVIDRDEDSAFVLVLVDGDLKVFDAFTGAEQTVTFTAAKTYLSAATPARSLRAVSVADYTLVLNTEVTVGTISAGSGGTFKGVKNSVSALPGSPADGDVWKVLGAPTDAYDYFYVKYDAATTAWVEHVYPPDYKKLDPATMPHTLTRDEITGAWEWKQMDWNARNVGDIISTPDPEFVGRTIRDIFFFRGRIGMISDESVTFSQAGDLFNFFPDKATGVLDADPVELTAQTNRVNYLRHALPFRKVLFATSDAQQFEIGADTIFTPRTASMTATTAYQIDPMCPPLGLGDQLYFAGKAGGSALIYEYFFDADTLSNTADDVTKHVLGYLPQDLAMIAGSTSAQRLYVLPDTARHTVYVYSFFWSGREKVQSAWSRLVLGDESDTRISAVAVMRDFLYLVLKRGDQIVLEKLPVETEAAFTGLGFAPLVDRRASLTGVYDPVNDWTTWTTPYKHQGDLTIVLGAGHEGQAGAIVAPLTYPTDTTVRATGDFAAAPAFVGKPYELLVKLSRQYPRDDKQEGQAKTTGRFQMRRITFAYKDTGYFEVRVAPEARPERLFKFTGRILGEENNAVGVPAVAKEGTFRVQVLSRADTAGIVISNPSPYPTVITSATYDGLYTNVIEQRSRA